MEIKKILICFLLSIPLFACAIVLKYELPNSYDGGVIKTRYNFKPDEFEINEPYNELKSVKFVVLFSEANMDSNNFNMLMKSALTKIGFKEVLNENEFSKYVIEKDISDEIDGLYNNESLRKVNNLIGPYLIIKVLSVSHNGYLTNIVEIYDPGAERMVLKIVFKGTLIANVNTEGAYPIINAISDWYSKNNMESLKNE